VEGVRTVAVDPGTATLTISYDPQKTSPEKVAQVIRKQGFSVNAIKMLN